MPDVSPDPETPRNDDDDATSPDEHNAQVKVNADELIVGRKLRFPIYDRNGLLLLAENSLITSRFKQLLKTRKIHEVRINQVDVASVTFAQSPSDQASDAVRFDTEITRQLNQLIKTESLSVTNSGPSVRQSMVVHGRKPYNPTQRKRLIEQQRSTTESLHRMVRKAVQSKRLDSNQIARIAGTYLSSMIADVDNVLSVACESARKGALLEHCLQVALLGMAIGIEMGLDASCLRNIALAGLIHDWGMLKVPKNLIDAKRILSEAEFVEIKKHPIYTLDLIEQITGLPDLVRLVCYQIHERPDGTGYPRGRKKDDIHLFARILQVADTYIALTSPRPYRPPLMAYAAMECLLIMAFEDAIDLEAVGALLQVQSLFPIGSLVALSDGSVARVLRRNDNHYTSPIVQLLEDGSGNRIRPNEKSTILDLYESKLYIEHALPTPGRQETVLSPEMITLKRS